MVTYQYTVSYDGPTFTIQDAINKVAAELSLNPTIDRDIVINVGDGSYAGFSIPDNALVPLAGTAYRLIIKSAGRFFPIIDFNLGRETQVAGIDVSSNNPNVTISGFRVQYFPVGIRASINSHYLIVKNCIVTNNRNVGILVDQGDEFQAIQNIVINGDYGIVARLCKNIAIVHNTIFQNGAIATERGKSICGLWTELAFDYGNGLSDTGAVHIIGNIVWSVNGRALTVFHDDIERTGAIYSNYNDFVTGDPANYIGIEDRTFYRGAESRPRRVLTTLQEWKQLGFDLNSINQDPRFISPVRVRSERNGFAIDLNLLPVSPVLGIVPSFFVNSTATAQWLPLYFDIENIATDILGNPRVQSGTAIGANDRATSAGFYGQDILTNPLDLNITKNCEVDPLLDIISNKLDIWFPKIKKGYFYSNEREYYLYTKKSGKYIGELAVTRFRLPSRISTILPIHVFIGGKEIEYKNYVDIAGDELVLYHRDLDIVNYSEEIRISCFTSQWKDGGFVYQEVDIIFKISDGDTRFFLPEDYAGEGPVVITDDKSNLTDHDSISNREYSLIFDKDERKTEIIFANDDNLIINGQFDYSPLEAPIAWNSNGVVCTGLREPLFPVAGSYCAHVDANGYINQLVPFCSGGNTLSFFASTLSGSTTLRYSAKAYDHLYNDLGYHVDGSLTPSISGWTRYYWVLGVTGDRYSDLIPTLPHPLSGIGYQFIPEETKYLDVTITNAGNRTLYLDGVQYENSPRPTVYHRKPFLNELTVEYETSNEEHFIDMHQSMSPVINYLTDGFLYIPEIPAKAYNGPNTPSITTLHEWRWPYGRLNILPWSRTKGKDKLYCRPDNRFHKEPVPKPEIILPAQLGRYVGLIRMAPSVPTVYQGDPNGVGFSISVIDTDGNPFGLALSNVDIVDPNARFPGWLFKTTFGLKEQLGQTVIANLDNSGLINLTWIPPSESESLIITKIPRPGSRYGQSDRISFINTRYPVNLDNHGNVRLLDSNGRSIKTYSDEYEVGIYFPKYEGNNSKILLQYPVHPGTISVYINGRTLIESRVAQIESDQFYVDYENSIVVVKGRFEEVQIKYKPSYIFVNQVDPYKIMFYHDKVFSGYSENETITVGYDYTIILQCRVQELINNGAASATFPLVAQNILTSDIRNQNHIGLEI